MTKILGIDYGKRKVGLALSYGTLAEPLKVVRNKNRKELIQEIKSIIKKENIKKIVVGVSEGEMKRETEEFVSKLRIKFMPIPCDTHSETLSTKDAIAMSIQAGQGPKKRKEMEDAFAAAIMLQSYLDA